jgi:hypothetical protein
MDLDEREDEANNYNSVVKMDSVHGVPTKNKRDALDV